MAKSKAQKKKRANLKQLDFVKTKNRLGKKKKVDERHRPISLQSKSIQPKQQLSGHDKCGSSGHDRRTHRGLSLEQLLAQTNHYSHKMRTDALTGIREFVTSSNEGKSAVSKQLPLVVKCISDTTCALEDSVRNASILLLKALLLSDITLLPFTDSIRLTIVSSFSHINTHIRFKSSKFLFALTTTSFRNSHEFLLRILPGIVPNVINLFSSICASSTIPISSRISLVHDVLPALKFVCVHSSCDALESEGGSLTGCVDASGANDNDDDEMSQVFYRYVSHSRLRSIYSDNMSSYMPSSVLSFNAGDNVFVANSEQRLRADSFPPIFWNALREVWCGLLAESSSSVSVLISARNLGSRLGKKAKESVEHILLLAEYAQSCIHLFLSTLKSKSDQNHHPIDVINALRSSLETIRILCDSLPSDIASLSEISVISPQFPYVIRLYIMRCSLLVQTEDLQQYALNNSSSCTKEEIALRRYVASVVGIALGCSNIRNSKHIWASCFRLLGFLTLESRNPRLCFAAIAPVVERAMGVLPFCTAAWRCSFILLTRLRSLCEWLPLVLDIDGFEFFVEFEREVTGTSRDNSYSSSLLLLQILEHSIVEQKTISVDLIAFILSLFQRLLKQFRDNDSRVIVCKNIEKGVLLVGSICRVLFVLLRSVCGVDDTIPIISVVSSLFGVFSGLLVGELSSALLYLFSSLRSFDLWILLTENVVSKLSSEDDISSFAKVVVRPSMLAACLRVDLNPSIASAVIAKRGETESFWRIVSEEGVY